MARTLKGKERKERAGRAPRENGSSALICLCECAPAADNTSGTTEVRHNHTVVAEGDTATPGVWAVPNAANYRRARPTHVARMATGTHHCQHTWGDAGHVNCIDHGS